MVTGPVLGSVRKFAGIAGQYGYAAEVTYDGEPTMTVQFIGNVYGGPIVMVTPGNPAGMFVRSPDRFGPDLNEAWVRSFYAQTHP